MKDNSMNQCAIGKRINTLCDKKYLGRILLGKSFTWEEFYLGRILLGKNFTWEEFYLGNLLGILELLGKNFTWENSYRYFFSQHLV